ncbi:MAG: lactonase family protein [Nitrospirales bacterium]
MLSIKKMYTPFALLMFSVMLLPLFSTASASAARLVGNAYVMDNNPDGNRVVVFGRFSNGELRRFGSVQTGGDGAGDNAPADPLGSQGSVLLSKNGRTLYVVNAGSNTVSVFFLTRRGRPILVQVVNSKGIFPVSLTSDGRVLYVLNSGGDGTISGYRQNRFGLLLPIPNSERNLGVGGDGIPVGDARNLAPGSISFDTLERRLLITFAGGGANGQLLTFVLEDDNTPSATPTVTDSEGPVPFTGTFTPNGTALIAEASGNVSSYNLGPDAELLNVSSAVPNGQAATCWIQSTSFGVAYTSNTTSGTITSYLVSRNGVLTLEGPDAADGIGAPIDFQLTPNERFLYVTSSSDGGVQGFKVNRRTGALRDIGLFPGLTTFDIDGFAPQGMAVR